MASNQYEHLLGQLNNPYGDGTKGSHTLGNWAKIYGLSALEQAGGDPVAASQFLAEQKAANRGGFGNTLKRIGSAVPKVASLAAIPLTLGAAGLGGAAAAGGASAASSGGLAGAAATGLKKILPDKLGGAVDWIGNNADKLLTLGGAAEGIYSGIRGEQLRKRALSQATVPMPKRQDLSSLFADEGNVYANSSLRKVG